MSNLSNLSSVSQDDRRALPGYEDLYEIDRAGNVYAMFSFRKLPAGRILNQHLSFDGYVFVSLSVKGKGIRKYIHRLLMLAFYPHSDSASLEVNHIDGVKTNNSLENLEWVTHAENLRHAKKIKAWKGSTNRGEKVIGSKLTTENILQIRAMRSSGMTHKQIAAVFGCTPTNISFILSGKTWAHIK